MPFALSFILAVISPAAACDLYTVTASDGSHTMNSNLLVSLSTTSTSGNTIPDYTVVEELVLSVPSTACSGVTITDVDWIYEARDGSSSGWPQLRSHADLFRNTPKGRIDIGSVYRYSASEVTDLWTVRMAGLNTVFTINPGQAWIVEIRLDTIDASVVNDDTIQGLAPLTIQWSDGTDTVDVSYEVSGNLLQF